ncbi:MAG: hypothetical protein LKJ47_04965 [Bifidobacteriaceae bacterium]|jgi:hypothetical protein|nr:hypothetical protein [Bifidobacteriaceae bacterium]
MSELVQASIDDLLTDGARTTDPDTSKTAAQRANRKGGQRIVLEAFAWAYRHGQKAINEETLNTIVFDRLPYTEIDLKRDSPRKRRSNLEDKGFIEPTGEKARNVGGSEMGLYRLTDRALEILHKEGLL